MKKRKLLLIGKIPPPIGGVTIHVNRLLEKLEMFYSGKFCYKNLSKLNIILAPYYLLKFPVFHLHSSNVYIRFYFAFLSKFLFSKCIITIHGDVGRYKNKYKNRLDENTLKLAEYPILLNSKSYNQSIILNDKSKLFSSFIPPNMETEDLNYEIKNKIIEFKTKYNQVFCTNAYNLSRDKYNQEIYGIFEIIAFFKINPAIGLVFSDPSGAYKEEFNRISFNLPSNILHINQQHSFFEVLKLSNFSIRNTSTDGDSISVKESLYLNKITFCTNIVSRPNGVILYERGQFHQMLNEFLAKKRQTILLEKGTVVDGSIQLIELYEKLLR